MPGNEHTDPTGPDANLDHRRDAASVRQPKKTALSPRSSSHPIRSTPGRHVVVSTERIASEIVPMRSSRSAPNIELTRRPCPTAESVARVVPECAYQAFQAGWRAGSQHRATQPMTSAVAEDIAALLDSPSVVNAVIRRG
ncbi:hypothetical protein ACFT2C_04835 [Promicromonospora sp. NPDC057138]|uniref:hypothetical protein n=1 Tax=Promicromonospora sp. NPDC057138 TaxID=3346031 RepID=UPI00362CB008